nr:MAG TPA: hypothetical protein [Bacteriophage sp.]
MAVSLFLGQRPSVFPIVRTFSALTIDWSVLVPIYLTGRKEC